MSSAVKKRRAARLAKAKEELKFLDAAYRAIIGGAQQYGLGSRSVTKAQLSTIIAEKNRLEDLIDALERPGGRFRRVVPVDR